MSDKQSSSFSQALLDIGAIASIDVTKFSASTLKCSVSHIKTLQRNNVLMTRQNLMENANKILDNLQDKHGKPINDLYKRQIGMTIKRLFPEAKINLKIFNRARSGASQNTRVSSSKFVADGRRIINRASELINSVYKTKSLDDLGMYDTCLAVLLTCCTSLRIGEILQLKLEHMNKIIQMEPINIKSKHDNNLRQIAPNDILLSTFDAIVYQRSEVEKYLLRRAYDFTVNHQAKRLKEHFIILSSEDYMRKKLHELAASLKIESKILGFNMFRKYITTLLIEGGGHYTAQSMNNHNSLDTTLDHYNVVTAKTMEDTYSKLMKTINNFNEKTPKVETVTKTEKSRPETMISKEQIKKEPE